MDDYMKQMFFKNYKEFNHPPVGGLIFIFLIIIFSLLI